MTPVEIATAAVSALLLLSRFVESVKPIWDRLPKAVAVLLPPVVALTPQLIALLDNTKTWADLTTYLIAAGAMLVTGLFPAPANPVVKPPQR